MPTLDVTAAILDPAFLDTLVWSRQAQTVGDDGRAVDAPTSLSIYGVITNDQGDVLMRLGDSAQVRGNITAHTLAKLSAGTSATDADIITWDGNDYTVDVLLDYSRYGQGFTAAACVPIPLAGT